MCFFFFFISLRSQFLLLPIVLIHTRCSASSQQLSDFIRHNLKDAFDILSLLDYASPDPAVSVADLLILSLINHGSLSKGLRVQHPKIPGLQHKLQMPQP